jgi:hypothetical protein
MTQWQTQEENTHTVLNTRLNQGIKWDFISLFYQDFAKDQSQHTKDA